MPKLPTKKRDVSREEKEAFVRDNWPLVLRVTYARRVAFPEYADDLLQAAAIGMFRSLEYYDASRGTKPQTYAVWWIRSAIQHELRRLQSRGLVGIESDVRKGLITGCTVSNFGDGKIEDEHTIIDPARIFPSEMEVSEFWRAAEEVLIRNRGLSVEATEKYVLILREVFRNGRTLCDVAKMVGKSPQSVHWITKRIVRMLRNSPEFARTARECA